MYLCTSTGVRNCHYRGKRLQKASYRLRLAKSTTLSGVLFISVRFKTVYSSYCICMQVVLRLLCVIVLIGSNILTFYFLLSTFLYNPPESFSCCHFLFFYNSPCLPFGTSRHIQVSLSDFFLGRLYFLTHVYCLICIGSSR